MTDVIDPIALGLTVFGVAGNEVACLCPYHNDHEPSAYFNVGSGLFYCFVCGTGKTARAIATDLGGRIVKVSAIIGKHIERSGSVLDWASLMNAPKAFNNPYLISRGVTAEAVQYFDIRAFAHGVGFPIRDSNGKLIGMQVRREGGTPRYLLIGERSSIWPQNIFIDRIGNRAPHVFAVEGVFGVLNAYKHGVEAYCTMGASAIQYASYAMRSTKKFKIWFDNDFAGYVGAARLFLKSDGYGRVIAPGVETDEIGQKEWDEACESEGTTSISLLSQLSGDEKKFRSLTKKDIF